MGKRRKRRSHHKYRYIPDVGTQHVIDQARKGHAGNIARQKFQRGVETAPAVEQAREDADRCAELRLTDLPRFRNVSALVAEVNSALGKLVQMLDGIEPTGMEYVKHCKPSFKRRAATVLINDENVANKAVEHKTLSLFGENIMVVRARATLSSHGFEYNTRKEPGSKYFNIKYAEFGVMEGKGFNTLWSSEDLLEVNRQYAQIQKVTKVLGLELGSFRIKAGDAGTGTFRYGKGSIRIEVPFHSIIAAAEYQRSSHNSNIHAVYLPLRHPPLLFREVPAVTRYTAWTFGEGQIQETRFVRTVDFTENRVFARVRAVRVFLGTCDKSFSNFASELLYCNIGESHPPNLPELVPSYQDLSKEKSIIMDTARKMKITFAVRYEVECLHAVGAVSLTELSNISFWNHLAKLPNVIALRVVDRLFTLAYEKPDYRIDAKKCLSEAIRSMTMSDENESSSENDDDDMLNDCSDTSSESDNEESIGAASASNRRITTPDAHFKFASVVSTENFHIIDPGVTQATQAILRDAAGETSSNSNWVPIRRVLVTPSRVLPCRAELDMLNRVLRQYSHLRERFIRVTFADENGESVSYQDSEDLYALVRKYLGDGIFVAGEHFVFLGFSSSQLREHGCWFYNEKPGFSNIGYIPSAADIRNSFGDLSNIRVPSRYAARMGQTLSSTFGTLTLSDNEFAIDDDISDSKKRYNFSDGVGMMSPELAQRVKKKLGINKYYAPSAYQIRFAGAKGVLAVWPSSRSQIVLRESMRKFHSTHREVEVVAVSKRLPFFLNRQIITILEGLGVASDVFLEIQRQHLADLDECLNPVTGGDASLDLLYKIGWGSGGNSTDRLRDTGPMTNAVQLFQAGLTCTNCEFLHEIMLAFRRRYLNDIRARARIPIERAACGIGIMDEIGILNSREIFAQFTDPISGVVVPVQGRVIVGRSPCLHPGDIQVVTAVTHPQLEHLVDVVVFPKIGDRPLPSMLSGGDLDGDIYCVIWDRRLTNVDATRSPMNYESEKEQPLDRDVTIDDVKDFVIRFMRNNNIGRIATAHLVHADREDDGIFSLKAKRLAILHSTAVDFAKTGIPALFPRDLMVTMKEKGQFPDFLGKHKKVSYKSNKALGRMYRECLDGKQNMGDTRFNQKGTTPIDEIFEQVVCDPEIEDEAFGLCSVWNSQVIQIMDQFGVEKEAEVISGQVNYFAMYNVVAKGRKKYFEQLTVLNRYMRQLKARFRAQFFSDIGEATANDTLNVDAVRKMAAWYKAAKKIASDDRKRGLEPILSFPYVVSDILVQIVAAHLNSECENAKQRERSIVDMEVHEFPE